MASMLARKKLFSWPLEMGQVPHLIGNRCAICGQLYFPMKNICSKCLDDQLEEVYFGRHGRLYSYSIIHVPSPGFKAPYAVGYVDLDEGLRLFSLITNWQEMDLRNGRIVELVLTKIGEDSVGNDVIGFAYEPRCD